MSLLHTSSLSIGYRTKNEKFEVQSDLNLLAGEGEMICLIGPNGSGKSTLIRTLSGLQSPLSGKAYIWNKDIEQLSNREKAMLLSLVLTDRIDVENATVNSIVQMGRHPYSSWWGSLGNEDVNKVQDAINQVHLEHKKNHLFSELSDGEKQRVMIAKAFAQDTPIIMLDEPTAHLDLPNRVEVMLLLHQLAHRTHKTVIISTHELDMALQAADSIWLMTERHGVEVGVPEDLVLNGTFHNAFKSDNYIFNPTNGNFSMNYTLTKEVVVSGEKTSMYWTLRALARAGYAAVSDAKIKISIEDSHWRIGKEHFYSIESLILGLNALTC